MEKNSKSIAEENIDAYLLDVPEAERNVLEKLRQAIRAAAPKAEEVISYQVPTFKYFGTLVCFAAFKNHCSFFVVNKDILKIFAKELETYNTSGTTIHFTTSKPLPALLIQKIVKMRVKENEERNASKIKKAKSK